MNRREANGVPWDIVEAAEDVIELGGMAMEVDGVEHGGEGNAWECWGLRDDMAVAEDCVRGRWGRG